MDIRQLEKELLRALRGRLSQDRLSVLLGYKSNKVYKWEAGLHVVSWLDFVRLAEVRKVDFRRSVRKLLGYKDGLGDSARFIGYLMGALTEAEVAKKLGVAASLVKRWKSGKAVPNLFHVLLLVDLIYLVLPEFIAALVEIERVPSALQAYKEKRARKLAIGENPALEAAMACLQIEIPSVSHARQLHVVGSALDLPISSARALIDQLIELGMVRDQSQRYEVVEPRYDTALNIATAVNIRRYWVRYLDRFLDLLATKPEDYSEGYFAYELFPVSAAADKEIVREYYEFYARLQSIVRRDPEPKTSVKFIGIQVLDLQKLAKK